MPKAGTKRKASGKSDASASKSKQPKQDGQKAVSKEDLDIPIDDGFNAAGTISFPVLIARSATDLLAQMSVHIDEDNMIYDASLNQTNIGNNANKVGG